MERGGRWRAKLDDWSANAPCATSPANLRRAQALLIGGVRLYTSEPLPCAASALGECTLRMLREAPVPGATANCAAATSPTHTCA